MEETEEKDKAPESRWDVIKYRLAMTLVVALLLVLAFMMVDGAVINFQCSFWDFITFECNRWDASFKPWK